MKKKIIVLAALLSTLSSSVFADINFPYSGFKEVEFANPYMTQEFESFISKMHSQDIELNKGLETAHSKYAKIYEKEKRMVSHRPVNEQRERIGRFVIKEERTFNELANNFIKNDIETFNKFISKVQKSNKLTQTEQIAFIKAVKPLHNAYQDTYKDYKIMLDSYNAMCFLKYDEASRVAPMCDELYVSLSRRIDSSKYHIANYMNKFVTKYKVESTSSNSLERLQNNIDEIKRMQSFKWE